jgi:hypothetical protein
MLSEASPKDFGEPIVPMLIAEHSFDFQESALNLAGSS